MQTKVTAMGRHSIRGVTTGQELDVRGRDSKRLKTHRISGGEYTTELVWVNRRVASNGQSYVEDGVRLTYSIAPQGPGKPWYIDKLHDWKFFHDHGDANPVGEWRRPAPPLGHARGKVTVSLEHWDPMATFEAMKERIERERKGAS